MSGFDIEGYLQRRAANPIDKKIADLTEATQRKKLDLANAGIQLRNSYERDQESWVGKSGFGPSSLTGEAINLAASFASGASRVGGQIAALPLLARAFLDEADITDRDKEAFARYNAGQATAEDMEILNRKKTIMDQVTEGSLTTHGKLLRAQAAREGSLDIADRFDISGAVHQGNRQKLIQALTDGAAPSLDQVSTGWDSLKNGEVLSGAADLVSGGAKLVGKLGTAAYESPLGALEYATENVPQLGLGLLGAAGKAGMLGSNVGYGGNILQSSIEKYRKEHNGELPPDAVMQEMVKHSGLAIAEEQLGDVLGLGFTKLGRKATEDAARIGLKQALFNTGKAATGGLVTEAVTEGLQTYHEGEAAQKPATAEDIYVGAAIGGLSGAHLSGGGRAVAEFMQATPEHVEQRVNEAQAKVTHEDAIKNNDPSTYLDKTSKAYNPVKAMEVYMGHARQEGVEDSVKADNIGKADELLSSLERQKQLVEFDLSNSTVAGVDAQIKEIQAVQADVDPTNAEEVAYFKETLTKLEAKKQLLTTQGEDTKGVKKLQTEAKILTKQLEEAKFVRDAVVSDISRTGEVAKSVLAEADVAVDPKDEASVTKSKAAIGRVITLAMSAPDSFSDDDLQQLGNLAKNMANGLTPEQRTYFRALSATRIAENKFKGTKGVNQDILFGSDPDPEAGTRGNLGIRQYRENIFKALSTGNTKDVTKYMAMFNKFLADHEAKKTAVGKAFPYFKRTGKPVQVVKGTDGQWSILTKNLLTPEQLSENGGLEMEPRSWALANQMQEEVTLLKRAKVDLKAMQALGTSATLQSTQTNVADSSAEVTTVDSRLSPTTLGDESTAVNQSNVNGTVNSTEGSTNPVSESPQGTGGSPVADAQSDEKTVEVKSRKPYDPANRDDLFGAILRATGKDGISRELIEQIFIEKKLPNSKILRTLFNSKGNGWKDIGALATRLRQEEGFTQFSGEVANEKADGELLMELIAQQASGTKVYNEERMLEEKEKDKSRQAKAEHKAAVDETNQLAKERGVKGVRGGRKIHHVLADIARKEVEEKVLEKVNERLGMAGIFTELNPLMLKAAMEADSNQELDAFIDELINELEQENDIEQDQEQSSGTQGQAVKNAKGTSQSSPDARQGDGKAEEGIDGATGTGEGTGSAPSTEAVADAGKLSLFKYFNKDLVGKKLQEVYQAVGFNPIAQFFVQKLTGKKSDNRRPLVAVKDFLTAWNNDPSLAQRFLTDTLEGTADPRQVALNNLKKYLNKWVPSITFQMTPSTLTKGFENQDLAAKFIDPETGEIDENFKTAMAYAVYNWVLNRTNATALTDHNQVLTMHGRNKEDMLTEEGEAVLQHMHFFENTVVDDLGGSILQAMGLSPTDKAGKDLEPRLRSALGTHAMLFLEKEGFITRKPINSRQVLEYFGVGPDDTEWHQYKPDATNAYISFNWEVEEGEKQRKFTLPDVPRDIRDNNAKTGLVVEKLFGTEGKSRHPSTEPVKFDQQFASGTEQGISKQQRKVLEQTAKIPHKIIDDMLALTELLPRELLLKIAGYRDLENEKIHAVNRKSIEAQNQNLENQLDQMLELVFDKYISKQGTDSQYYVTPEVWRNFRQGFADGSMNLQTSKIHRAFFARPDWTVELDLANPEMMKEFKIAVGMNLGLVKTDQQRNVKSLDLIDTKLNPSTDAYKAIDALRQILFHGATVNAETGALIEKVAKKGGMLGLQTMVAYAKYMEALASHEAGTGPTKFSVTMLVGADGKTNGPMLTHLALGAASSLEGLYVLLNRGGMYSTDKGQPTHFGEYYEGDNAMDLYEDLGGKSLMTAQDRIASLEEVAARDAEIAKAVAKGKRINKPKLFTTAQFAALQAVTGKLLGDDGKVTSAGRNLTKTPLTSFAFGSSLTKSIKNMEDAFIQSFYDTIEKIASGEIDTMTMEGYFNNINILLKRGDSKVQVIPAAKFKEASSVEQVLEIRLDSQREAALRNAFQIIMGKPTQATMETYFETFVSRRKNLNSSIQGAFAAYHHAFQHLRDQEIQRLMDTGELHYRDVVTAAGKSYKEPIGVLNAEQERALKEKTQALMPLMHTAYSKAENDLASALFMAKRERGAAPNTPQYKVKVGLKNKIKAKGSDKEVGHLSPSPMIYREISPGVAGTPYAIHSSDSFIMHRAMEHFIQALNVHDEIATAVVGENGIAKAAEAINKATVEAFLEYSPAAEARDMLERVVSDLAYKVSRAEVPASVVKEIFATWADTLNHGVPEEMWVIPEYAGEMMMGMTVSNAYAADTLRLQAIAKMAYMDQYTWEGGQYKVSPEIRAKAEAMLRELQSEPSIKFRKDMEYLTKVMEGDVTAEGVTPEWTENQAITPEGDGALGEELPNQGMDGAAVVTGDAGILQPDGTLKIDARIISHITDFAWGKLGFNRFGKHSESLAAAFRDKPEMSASEVVELLKKENLSAYETALLSKMVDILKVGQANGSKLKFKIVTPGTPLSELTNAPTGSVSGWYTAGTEGDTIYVLSKAFAKATLNKELLLHEMLHGALFRAIEEGITSKDPKVLGAVNALKELADEVHGTLMQQKLFHIARAIKDRNTGEISVHELLSWGMTNEPFQKILKATEYRSSLGKSVVNGFKQFVNKVLSLLGMTDPKKNESDVQGMEVLLAGSAQLFSLAAGTDFSSTPGSDSLSMAADPVQTYTTHDIYDVLGAQGTVSTGFDAHLRSVLTNISEKLYGPYGSLEAARMANQSNTAEEVWEEAKANNKADFALEVLVAGFPVTEQEAYVMEQVEATVKAALDSNDNQTTFAYRELYKLYKEVKAKVKPADFNTGDPVQDKKLYDFIFKLEAGPDHRSDYLARFAAMGLAHEGFNKLLSMKTESGASQAAPTSLVDRLNRLFEQLMNWVAGKLTHTYAGQEANQKLNNLTEQLARIESKKRDMIPRDELTAVERTEEAIQGVSAKLMEKVEAFGKSKFFKNSSFAPVRAVGAAMSTVAGDRVGYLVDAMKKLASEQDANRQSLISGLIAEMQGVTEFNKGLEILFRATKNNERLRKEIIAHTQQHILQSFSKEHAVTKEESSAMTSVLLRTGVHSLLEKYKMAGIQKFLNSPSALNKEIAALDNQLKQFKDYRYYLAQSKALGFDLVHDQAKVKLLLKNARAIARLAGTERVSALSEVELETAEDIIDRLSTLYAISYSRPADLVAVRAVVNREATQGDSSGVEMILRLQQSLYEQSKDKLFGGNGMLMQKGYVSEIYNPHRELVVVDLVRGRELEARGYVQVSPAPADPDDVGSQGKERFLYVRKDAGLLERVSGAVSTTSRRAAGSRAKDQEVVGLEEWKVNQKDLRTMQRNRKAAINELFTRDPSWDPSQEDNTYAVPVLNDQGQVASYRYIMSRDVKDKLLDRDNRMERVLGMFNGSIYDKASVEEQNAKVIRALKDQYDADFTKNSKEYVNIGPASQNYEHLEIWRLLSEDTKAEIVDHWGIDPKTNKPVGIYVRKDMLDRAFGYRKLSLSNIFAEDAKLEGIAEKMIYQLGHHVFGDMAELRVRQGERAWQEVNRMVNTNIVIRAFSTLKNNQLSNISELIWAGVPLRKILYHHRVAFQGALDYRKQSKELHMLESDLASGNLAGRTEAEIKDKIIELQDHLARNPVKEAIDLGMMSSLVEDVELDTDDYSYASQLSRKVEEHSKKLNKHVVSAAKAIYLTKDNKVFQALHYGTQISDFLARYTYYQHLLSDQKNHKTKQQAALEASEMFVYYDTPSHRKLQYANDMGLVRFTKYYLRIQKIIAKLYKEKPGRALAMIALDQYFDGVPMLMESSMITHPHSPLSIGALAFPGTLDEIITIKTGLGLVN